MPGDVTDPGFSATLCRQIVDAGGRLDILVNNARVLLSKLFEVVTREEWRRLIAVNLEAVYSPARRRCGSCAARVAASW